MNIVSFIKLKFSAGIILEIAFPSKDLAVKNID